MPNVDSVVTIRTLGEVAWLASRVGRPMNDAKVEPTPSTLRDFWQSIRKLQRSWTESLDALLLTSGADLAHLEYLPSGNTALTRRATKHSPLRAVVVQWARARKRYERQGILVTAEALRRAEEECLADEDRRARQRERAAERRENDLKIAFAQRDAELNNRNAALEATLVEKDRFLAAFTEKERALSSALA